MAFISAPLAAIDRAAFPVRSCNPLMSKHVVPKFQRSTLPLQMSSMDQEQLQEPSKDFVLKETDEVLAPAYAIPAACCAIAVTGLLLGDGWTVPALPFVLLGPFLAFQTTMVRFVFTDSALVVAKADGNKFRYVRAWKYSYFVNWEVWWEKFPVLCYFKEAESYEGRGSIHFFPMLFDSKQLVRCLQKHTVNKSNYSQQ